MPRVIEHRKAGLLFRRLRVILLIPAAAIVYIAYFARECFAAFADDLKRALRREP